MTLKRYEQFPHTADIGIRVFGSDLKELFSNAAFALFDTVADIEGLTTSVEEKIKVSALDHEELLVAWLDELLYLFYTRSLIFCKFDIEFITETGLKGVAYGRPIGQNRNRLKMEVKAVTYNDLKIRRTENGFVVEMVFDV